MAIESKKVKPTANVYTAMLAIATVSVVATAAYVAIACLAQYGTVFKVAVP